MKRIAKPLVLIALVAGCGRRDFGVDCKQAAELDAPWSALDLKLDEKEARVCSSSTSETKIRSYSWKSESDAMSAAEGALEGAGFTKDKCNTDKDCWYQKDDQRVYVHAFALRVKKNSLVTLTLKESARTRTSRK